MANLERDGENQGLPQAGLVMFWGGAWGAKNGPPRERGNLRRPLVNVWLCVRRSAVFRVASEGVESFLETSAAMLDESIDSGFQIPTDHLLSMRSQFVTDDRISIRNQPCVLLAGFRHADAPHPGNMVESCLGIHIGVQ